MSKIFTNAIPIRLRRISNDDTPTQNKRTLTSMTFSRVRKKKLNVPVIRQETYK